MEIEGKTYILVQHQKPKCKIISDVFIIDGPRGGQYIFTVFHNGFAYIIKNGKRQKVTSWSMAA